jgi:hypothetical protein
MFMMENPEFVERAKNKSVGEIKAPSPAWNAGQ